jgi:hypothetical protein
MADKKLIVDLAKGTQTYVDLTPEERQNEMQRKLLRQMQSYLLRQSSRPSVLQAKK